MNISFIITRGDSIGGAQIHVRDVCMELKKDGHTVKVFTGCTGDFTAQLDAGNIPYEIISDLVRPVRPLQDIKAVISLVKKLKNKKPDLLSCHTAKSGMVGRLAAFLAGVPSLFTAHGWQFADGIPGKQALPVLIIEKFISGLSRKIITVSDYDYNLAVRKKAVSEHRLVTIHNGLPWMDFETASMGRKHDPDMPCKLIFVARFQDQKDHETLLNALGKLKDLNWRLELIGDGPKKGIVENLCRENEIEKRVRFLGQRRDVPERLARADIFLLISHWEGFPRSIIEAMRAGLPVIASDVGGCGESVINGETGFLVPQKDTFILEKTLRELIENPEKRKTMGKNGRRRYEAEFTFKKMYNRTIELYKSLIR